MRGCSACTVAYWRTPSGKVSWGAHMQLFILHGGPLTHPIKQNQLGGPHAAVQPARWPIDTPNQAKSAGRPTCSGLTCAAAHWHTP
jgi:hypothetical protein